MLQSSLIHESSAIIDATSTHDKYLKQLSTKLRTPAVTGQLAKFSVQDPTTGQEIALVEDAPVDLADAYLECATLGWKAWENESPRHRSNVLLRASELLLDREAEIAATITREMGKPLNESLAEVRFSADYFRWYSEEAVRSAGEYREAPGGGARLLVSRRAIGVCLFITPWNFPLAMAARKAAAALAAGCSVILKPAEATPLSALALADVLREAGLPVEAFQIVTTSNSSGWSSALMSDVRLHKVSFTGSTRIGRKLVEQSAQHLQKLSLELGGDAPFIVFNDADINRAVEGAMISKIRNGGQACVAANRFLVEKDIAPEFVSEFSRRLGDLTLGSGFDSRTDLGPLISKDARTSIVNLIDNAVSHGATAHLDSSVVEGPGNFQRPQLLTGIPASATIASAEIFGPVAAVQTFDSESEAIDLANASPFGLASYIFSSDIDRAFRVAHALHTGVLGINKGLVADASGPFGGTGYSGYGREGGSEGMQDFQVIRQFNMDLGA